MPGQDNVMDTDDASPTAQVWNALKPEIDGLRDEVVCLIPNTGVKNQVKEKFATRSKTLKSKLTAKVAELNRIEEKELAAESSASPEDLLSRGAPTGRVNISDLKANLAEEWGGSLDALFQTIVSNPITEEHMSDVVAKRDLYVRKVGAALNAFEQQLADRFRSQGTFEPLDFARQSLEADPPFEGDVIGNARVSKLEDDLAQAERHIAKLEGDLQTLHGMLETRNKKISELQKQLTPLSYVANILGCEETKIQQSVNEFVGKLTALQIDNDQLRNQVTNANTFRDHSACQKQISDLQTELQLKEAIAVSSAKTIKDRRDTIESLRDQLNKHGIGGSLEARLKRLGFDRSNSDVGSSASSDLSNSLDVNSTLLDFNVACSCHKNLKLSMVMGMAVVPACADLWIAKDPNDLAQGLQIAESLLMTSESRALFFNNNYPLASASAYAKPTEDSLVPVMCALASLCTKRRQAFVDAAFKQLSCSTLAGVDKADLKVTIAERVRAELDNKKSLRNDDVIVLGGHNGVPLRQFFETTHLQAGVQHIFIWIDADNEQFKLAQQSQLVPALHNVVLAAAKWRHVYFAVLPVPYAYSLLPTFDSFMHEFNKFGNDQPNVLWLNDAERADGVRFAHSLGSNALVTDFTAVDKTGRVSPKSARAALRFIRSIKPALVPEQVDLSDPPPQQQSAQQSSSSYVPNLHGVRHGGVQKNAYGNYASRGALFKRGGAGGRGSGNNNLRGKGSRRRN